MITHDKGGAQPNKQRQHDSQHSAPFVLLAVAQTLTQKALHADCVCAGRYISFV